MKDLLDPHVLDMVPYKPGKPIEELQREYSLEKVVKLASNENPSSVPPNVAEAIKNEIVNLNFYPDSENFYLIQRLAQYIGVQPENVIVGAGSVEIIRLIVQAFLKPGETVLTSEKSFMMCKLAAVEKGGKSAFVAVPMGDDYTFDLDAIYNKVDEKTKIIFLTNPNNPTGTMVKKEKVLEFIAKIPGNKIIVLDNAYHEYVGNHDEYEDGIQLSLARKNIIVLRTFSKVYALAGLRVGYAISNPEIISYLNRLKPPFNVTRLAQVAAIASLENDDFKNRSVAVNAKNREKLSLQLKKLGMRVFPTQANFIMFIPPAPADVNDINLRLLKEGVIIRPLQSFGVPEALRVTVGYEEENDFFIEKLEKVLIEIKK